MIELFGQFPQDLLRDGQDTGVWFDEAGEYIWAFYCYADQFRYTC